MLSDFTCQCPGIQNDASCSVRVTNSSAILSGCFSSSKVATQVKGVGVRCTRGSVRLSDIQAVRKHLNDSTKLSHVVIPFFSFFSEDFPSRRVEGD